MFEIDMNDPWVQMYAKLPHHEKINGKWYYVHFGGELISEVSEEKAKELEKDKQMWDREWEKMVKELEEKK